jgi:murein DD-endopeptidase MepM/ murein hydrolase activator NlpD
LVRKGDQVLKGQTIGLIGNSGNSTQPHLHFEVNRGIPRGDGMPYVFERFEYLGTAPASGPSRSDIAESITDRIRKRSQINLNVAFSTSTIIGNIIKDSFKSLESNSKADIAHKGRVFTFEMPVSGSLIRISK